MRRLQFNDEIVNRFKNALVWMLATIIVSLGFTLLMYYFEKDVNVELQSFDDLVWWWVVTIAGVGYGDILPITNLGRFFGSLVIASSLVLLAIVVSEFAALAKIVYEHRSKGIVRVSYKGHIVIYGYTSLTAGLIKLLKYNYGSNVKIVLISNDVDINPFPNHVDFVHANPIFNTTFKEANIKDASAAIILANDRFNDPDAYSLVIASGIEKENTRVTTLVEIVTPEMKHLFKEKMIDAFIDRKDLLRDLIEGSEDSKLVRIINKQTDLDEKAADEEKHEDIELV